MRKKVAGFMLLISMCALLAAAATATKQDFEMVPVTEGIYAFIATESNSGVVQGNIILVIGENSALLVDSGQFPSLASRIALKVQELTKKPVRFLVNTHWHGDHLLANHIFKKAFPGLLVIAHEETVRYADQYYAKWDEQLKGYPKLIETLRKYVKDGKTEKGRILSEDEKMGLTIDTEALESMLPDLSESRYEPVDMKFQKEISVDLGKRTVRILNLGRGNTAGDAVIFVPDAKVLITGDTVVYPTPYSFGSYHSEWIEVLNKMMQLGAETYIPGHGPVLKDASYLKTLVELLEDVRTKVQAAVKENMTLEQIREKIKLEDWNKRLAGDNPYRQRAFREFFVQPGIERAYKEAKGEALTE